MGYNRSCSYGYVPHTHQRLAHPTMIVDCHSYGFHLGLGCCSGAYLLYGVISTLIWLFCVLSSVLAHCYRSFRNDRTAIRTLIWGASLILRYTAKCMAACNA